MVKRFLSAYVLLCFLPCLLLGVVVSSLSQEIVFSELKHTASLSLDETNRTISAIFSEMQRMVYRISSDPDINQGLELIQVGETEAGTQTIRSTMAVYHSFANDYLSVQVAVSCSADAASYITAAASEEEVPTLLLPCLPDYQEAWYLDALEYPDQFIWSQFYNGNAYVLRQSKAIYDKDSSEILGVASVDLFLGQIHSIALQIGENQHRTYLVEENGVLIYPYYVYDKIPEDILVSGKPGSYQVSSNLILVSQLRNSSWRLIKVLPLAEMSAEIHFLRTITVVLSLIFFGSSLCMALYLSVKIFNPISKLADKMRTIQTGTLSPLGENRYHGEIGELYNSFDYMINRINQQISQLYTAQIRQKDSELRALQAQINPHFLYNTLDSINWLALRYKADDISRMVCSLSDMLRLSLNKGRNIITLKDELQQVKSYITLQQMRFKDKFEVIYEVDDDLLKTRVIKMLLQPIVENAIVHGFEQYEGTGIIRICIHSYDENLLSFEVSNNGTLINLSVMEKKLDPATEDSENRRGYGIRNVNERIHACYGLQYGIQYSIRDTFTVASFIIPKEVKHNETGSAG